MKTTGIFIFPLLIIHIGYISLTSQIQIQSFSSKYTLVAGTVSLSNSNTALISTLKFNSKIKSQCFRHCLLTSNCYLLSISFSNSTCYFFDANSLSQSKISANDVNMYSITRMLSTVYGAGMVSYWSFNNNLMDYIGGIELIPMSNVGFSTDRFNNSDSSLSLTYGYCQLPTGIYLNGDYSIVAWVRVNELVLNAKLFDCGNSQADNLEVSLSSGSQIGSPYICYTGSPEYNSNTTLPLGEWHYLAAIARGNTLLLYIDANLVASGPLQYQANGVSRADCYVGRSNWYPGEGDACADYDDLRIFNRALSQNEISYFMSIN